MNNQLSIYLDFKDVLIKPQISFLESRKDVLLESDIYSKKQKSYLKNWKPFPVMSANMDTITGTKLAFELLKRNWIAVLHKYVSIEEISDLYDQIEKYNNEHKNNQIDSRNLFISRGTKELDRLKLKERLEKEPRILSVCIDVANGYRQSVFEYIRELREGICKDKILMVGNVATVDAVEMYDKIGVDCVKCGIGPGCFVEDTKIKTKNGIKELKDVQIGDYVLTHQNQYSKVVNTLKREVDDLMNINDFLCTPEHKFYVLNKKYVDIVNDNNIYQYAEFIEAQDLNDNYYLLEINND